MKEIPSIDVQAMIELIEPDCVDKECPNCQLSSSVTILGVAHHVTLVQVKDLEEGNEVCGEYQNYEGQAPVGCSTYYDRLAEFDPGGTFHTVTIPGYEGRYVCIITPFQR